MLGEFAELTEIFITNQTINPDSSKVVDHHRRFGKTDAHSGDRREIRGINQTAHSLSRLGTGRPHFRHSRSRQPNISPTNPRRNPEPRHSILMQGLHLLAGFRCEIVDHPNYAKTVGMPLCRIHQILIIKTVVDVMLNQHDTLDAPGSTGLQQLLVIETRGVQVRQRLTFRQGKLVDISPPDVRMGVNKSLFDSLSLGWLRVCDMHSGADRDHGCRNGATCLNEFTSIHAEPPRNF